jgi:hypothetical protein
MKFQFPRVIPTISEVHAARGDTDGALMMLLTI